MLTSFQAIPGRVDFCLKLGVLHFHPKQENESQTLPLHLAFEDLREYRISL